MISDDMTNNAKWLYSRCSRARASMGTSLSTLDLCLKIFEVIKETDDEDDIQIPLMEALKDTKQRDVAFIFELCGRAGDLRDDDELTEEALRNIDTEEALQIDIEEEIDDGFNECDLRDDDELTEEVDIIEEEINFDEMQSYQLRTRVLGLNMPTFKELWKYLQEAGWTYTSGVYHIPSAKRQQYNSNKNVSARTILLQMDVDNETSSSLHPQEESDAGEQDEEGPEEFTSPNDLVDYLDEYCMPDYRASPAEIEAQQKLMSTKSKAYQRRNKRLRWELLEVAYRYRSRQRLNQDDDTINNMPSKYGHNNRKCEVCFKGAHPLYPRVACRECRLVVHTNCYGLVDYDEDATTSPTKQRVDEKGLFTCDVCCLENGSYNKAVRWNASQSSGFRIHHHPNAICSLCESNSIAGGMVKIEGEQTKRTRKRSSVSSGFVHLFCINGLLLPKTAEPIMVRTKEKEIQTRLQNALEKCTEKEACGSCGRRKGDLIKCRGKCEKYFHRLCIQIERRNDAQYNARDHLCLGCCIVEEETMSNLPAEKPYTAKRSKTEETEQYFDKRPIKRLATTDEEYVITIPTVKLCATEAEKLHEEPDLSSSLGKIEENYQRKFKEWSFLLATKQSILLYGLGSKKEVLSAFGKTLSNEGDVLNINGYDENIDLYQLCDYINMIFLEGRVATKMDDFSREPNEGMVMMATSVAKKFASTRSRPLFILIHTIDGAGLSNNFSQRSLQALTQSGSKDKCPMIRIAASVDNINTAMSLWSPHVEYGFDWSWQNVNTYTPFLDELRDGPQTTVVEKTKKITSTQKTGVAVMQVLASLAPRHTEVLHQLVTLQQENGSKSIPYATLKEACMQKMITGQESLLRSVLGELSDHDIIKKEKDEGGNEYWCVHAKLHVNDILHFKR